MKTLRTDQAAAIENVRGAMRETRRVVLQSPCGWGKTVVAGDIVRSARDKDKRALITVPALSLVDQTVASLYAQGITEVGVIQANHVSTDWSKPVQVASVYTLMKRGTIPEAAVVIVDECHKWFKFFEGWFAGEAWRKVPIIGLSATPWLKGLGAYFDKLIVGNTIEKMIGEKTLAPFRVYAASHPDLDGVRTERGDYVESDLVERMGKPKLVADAVQAWKDLAEDRPTICFAVNRDHARQLANEFEAGGVPSGYMDCETPSWERQEIRRKLLSGDVRVVCNVDVIGLGVDWPEISCVSYCRPTRSEMRFVQNVGRGLRVIEGKTDLIVIDHSDTTLKLGFVSDIHHDELDDGKPKISSAPIVELPKECPQCHYLKPPRMAKCPKCGHVVEHHATPIKHESGTLKEIKPEDINRPAPAAKKFPDKAKTYGQLLWYSRGHGYSPGNDGWAKHKYRALYGVWPQPNVLDWRPHFRAPEMDLASWIKSQFVRHAKGNRWTEDNVQNDRPKGAVATVGRIAKQFTPGTMMTEDDWKALE
jgi:DNA repair protein RadD